MIQSIGRQNVVDTLYNQMLGLIISGEWEQDVMIPSENDLSEAFGVSRDTVRQAINRFKALGILCSYQGKGTYVQKIDTSFYLNLIVPAVFIGADDGVTALEFMKAIQVESVRIVCKQATDEEILLLSQYVDAMSLTDTHDYDSFFEYDMNYHSYLVQLTKNSLFEKTMDIVKRLLHVCLKDVVTVHGNEKSIQQHVECFSAIQNRNTEEAIGIISAHYDMLLVRTKEWLALDKDERDTMKKQIKSS